MKLAGFLGCLLALASFGLVAQSGAQSATPNPPVANRGVGPATSSMFSVVGHDGKVITYIFTPAPPAAACPVSMQASHLSDGSMIKTGRVHPNGVHPKGIGQRLHLTLASPDQRTITSATLELRGWNATGRMERTALHNEDQTTRTVTASFTAGSARTASADVWASGLTAVTLVELLSVRYSDGTTWMPAQSNTCHVSPDPMMLIASH